MAMAGKSEKPKKRQPHPGLKDHEAWEKTTRTMPSYGMGASRDQVKVWDPAAGAEGDLTAHDIIKSLNSSKASLPSFTLAARLPGEEAKGAWVPGPGEYHCPDTLSKTHPTVPISGRGWHWGSTQRASSAPNIVSPGPSNYDVKFDQVRDRQPSWNLSFREAFVANNDQRVASTDALYNTFGMKSKGGPVHTPKWTFTARGKSALLVSGGEGPGVGTHSPENSNSARIKRTPSYSFGTSARWGKPLPERPY
jgi:hypothetical protein